MRWAKIHVKGIAVSLVLIAAVTVPLQPVARTAQTRSSAERNQKSKKPLAGYTVIVVEPFSIERNAATMDFPSGEEANLQLSTITRLRASRDFEQVVDASLKPAEEPVSTEPSAPENPRKLILSSTVIGFSKGSSAARFMTWPLPVGVSKAKVRFVFRDAESNEEVFRFEKEAKFQATISGGVATKEEQMAHLKGGLAEALLKEIERNH